MKKVSSLVRVFLVTLLAGSLLAQNVLAQTALFDAKGAQSALFDARGESVEIASLFEGQEDKSSSAKKPLVKKVKPIVIHNSYSGSAYKSSASASASASQNWSGYESVMDFIRANDRERFTVFTPTENATSATAEAKKSSSSIRSKKRASSCPHRR